MRTSLTLARFLQNQPLIATSQRAFSNFRVFDHVNSGMPKHDQLFTDDYYQQEKDEGQNPYDTVKDGEGVSKAKGSHQMTQAGVLSQYKK